MGLSPAEGQAGTQFDLGLPEIVGLGYDLKLRIGQVWPDGQVAHDLSLDFANHPDEAQELWEKILPTTLAWVDLFAQTRIMLRHSPQILEHSSSPYDTINGIEFIKGQSIAIRDTHYLVVRNFAQPVFLTASQIREEGELRPDMKKWFIPLVKRGSFGILHHHVFESMLSPDERARDTSENF